MMQRVFALSLVLSLSCPLLAGAQELADPAQHLIDQVRAMRWQPVEKGAKGLAFEDIVKRTRDSATAAIADAQVDEARGEAQKLKNEGALLSWLVPPRHLEDAARAQIEAAQLRRDAVMQQALLDNAQGYLDLLSAMMVRQAAYYELKKAIEQLRLDETRFTLGEITNLTVIESQNRLLNAYRQFQQTAETTDKLSAGLSVLLGHRPDSRYAFKELQLASANERFVDVARFPTVMLPEKRHDKLVETLTRIALRERPDYNAQVRRREALERLLDGFGNKNDPQHQILRAQLSQVRIAVGQGRETIVAEVETALHNRDRARESLSIGHAQVLLAQKALRQARISQQSGFSSAKDVLDAEGVLVQAQAGLGRAQLGMAQADLTLLQRLGLMRPDLLGKAQPIVLGGDPVLPEDPAAQI